MKNFLQKNRRWVKWCFLLILYSLLGISYTYASYRSDLDQITDSARVGKYQIDITNEGVTNQGEILDPNVEKELVWREQENPYLVKYTVANNSEVLVKCDITMKKENLDVDAFFKVTGGTNEELTEASFPLASGESKSLELSIKVPEVTANLIDQPVTLAFNVAQID